MYCVLLFPAVACCACSPPLPLSLSSLQPKEGYDPSLKPKGVPDPPFTLPPPVLLALITKSTYNTL